MISDANRAMAQYAVKQAVSAHTAIKKWQDWCAGLTAAMKDAGLYSDDADYLSYEWRAEARFVENKYTALNKRPPMPAKVRKHRMYDDTYRAAALVGIEVPPGSINSMEDVFRTLASVTSVLAVS